MASGSIQLDGLSSILFIGNSYTFGRVDPVMHYNTAEVRDLTAPSNGGTFTNTTGSNPYEPHPWGGVPGVFNKFADQTGLNLDVAISARNAASLQGHYLNSNPAGWDLRGNLASQSWDTVVLQDNSTQTLHSGSGTITFAANSATATLTLDPTADGKQETDETIGITLASGTGYRVGSTGTISGTILNDEPAPPAPNPALPTVTLVATSAAVLEDSPTGRLVYTFTRSGPTTSDLVVQFTPARDGSTAPSVTAGNDFDALVGNSIYQFQSGGATTAGNVGFTSPASGSITIKAGSSTATLTLDPHTDTTVESDESIRFTLNTSTTYNVGTQGPVSITILNDDYPAGTDLTQPAVSLSLVSDSGVYEDGASNLVWQFSRSGSTTQPLTVNFGVSGTATLPGNDFTVVSTSATTFVTAGASDPDLPSFQTYAVKLAQYARTGAADTVNGVPANANANAATDVYLYETWARPNLVTGAVVATTDQTTGAITNTSVTAPEFYTSLEGMTADLRAAYEGLAAANPIFKGVAPVGAAFMSAVQQGLAIRDPYHDAQGNQVGNIDLWWDDNLHASKYGSYLSALTLFGVLTGIDPRSLGAGETAASELGITSAVAGALQNVAAATDGFSLQANWTAPGKVTELQGTASGVLASAGAFNFSDTNKLATHTVSAAPAAAGSLGTLAATLRSDSTGDGTGGAVNWIYTVDDSAVEYLNAGETRVEHFLVTVADNTGGAVSRDIAITVTGTGDPPVAVSDLISLNAHAIATGNLLANDRDPEGDLLQITSVRFAGGVATAVPAAGTITVESSHGALTVDATGRYSYVTAAAGLESFSYTVSDGHGGTAVGAIMASAAAHAPDPDASFNFAFLASTLSFVHGEAILTGPDGLARDVTGIGTLRFTDGTIVESDGTALVDDLFYLAKYRDVYAAGVDADMHYAQSGWREGRDPSAFFSTNGYLAANPDVAQAGLNPLVHYDLSGWREGRNPGPAFDTRSYLAANPDVAAAGIDPLAHYLSNGQQEGRPIFSGATIRGVTGDFDANFYLASNPDVAAARIDPFQHFLATGWREGRNPDAYFSTLGYLAANPEVAQAGIDPLLHYEAYGWREGRNPSSAFSSNGYLAANPDVAAAHIDPLQHYLQYGQAEGRHGWEI